MFRFLLVLSMVAWGFAENVSFGNGNPNPAPAAVTAPAKPHPASPAAAAKKKKTAVHPPAPKTEVRVSDWRSSYDEAKNLLVPNQKYILRFEDEDTFGRVGTPSQEATTMTFSQEDVEKFREAMQTVSDYVAEMRRHCFSASAKTFITAIDKYTAAIGSFNRRALPIVGDITENNNFMMLVVNRTTLKDVPVLTSRFLQFKKQRFKEALSRFQAADAKLISSMVSVAKTLKVDFNEQDWNKAYGLRDSSLELISLWPRDPIFTATAQLADNKETACSVLPVVATVASGPAQSIPVPADSENKARAE